MLSTTIESYVSKKLFKNSFKKILTKILRIAKACFFHNKFAKQKNTNQTR